MTDEEKIALLALMLGDIPGGPYYPLFTQEQYAQFLVLGKGDVYKSVVWAALSASSIISSDSSREVIGELQISSSSGTNYLKFLDYLMQNASKVPPANMMPWFGNDGVCDRNKLLDYRVCDVVNYETFLNVWHKTGENCCSSC